MESPKKTRTKSPRKQANGFELVPQASNATRPQNLAYNLVCWQLVLAAHTTMEQGEEDLAALMLRNRTAFEKLPRTDVDVTNDELATGARVVDVSWTRRPSVASTCTHFDVAP